MMRRLWRWILYKVLRWQKDVTIVHPQRCIICLAPHTSNSDFLLGQLYLLSEGFTANFLMKREWFVPPLSWLWRAIGGIAVDRSTHTTLTDQLAATALERDYFCLAITPEGTRAKNPTWRRGFYYIALKAHLPILLYALDYERRLISCTKLLIPTGDYDADIEIIRHYYKDVKGKHPERFTVG